MQLIRLIHSPHHFTTLLRGQLMFKNARTLPTSDFFNQVRLFRHKPEDVSRVAGRPEKKQVEPPSDVPGSAQAKFTNYSPVMKMSTLKQLAAQYGPTAFVVFVFISLTNLSLCYVLVKMGFATFVINSQMFIAFAQKYQYAQFAGEFMIAYVLHKFLAPLRYLLTGLVTPVIVRALRKKGWLKEPPKG